MTMAMKENRKRYNRRPPEEGRNILLSAAIVMFIERGFTGATAKDISLKAGYTTGAMFNFYDTKEEVLLELIKKMFSAQFETAQILVPPDDTLLLYGAETALQLTTTELSEPLRDIYVSAYSLPSTSELIYKMTAEKLPYIFEKTLPGYKGKDFYELEIATGGTMRSYMAKPCDLYFTLEQKIRRFLEATLCIYRVSEDERNRVTEAVLRMDMKGTAEKMISVTVDRAQKCIETLL